MKVNLKQLLCCVSAGALVWSGCSSPRVYSDALDPKYRGQITRIGLIEPGAPSRAQIEDPMPEAVGFGIGGLVPALIGAAVTSASASKWSARFEEATHSAAFNAPREFITAMEEELEKAGYKVDRIPMKRPTRLLEKGEIPNGPTDVDALLDVAISSYGFMKSPLDLKDEAGKDFIPRVVLNAQLLSADGQEVYFKQPFVNFEIENFTIIDSAPGHRFKNTDELVSAPEKALEGIRIATRRVAEKVRESLTLRPSAMYVYRDHKNPEFPLRIDLDDKVFVILGANECFYRTIDPGKHKVRIQFDLPPNVKADADPAVVDLDVQPGGDYFIESIIESGFLKVPVVRANLKSQADGRAVVEKMRQPVRPAEPAKRPGVR